MENKETLKDSLNRLYFSVSCRFFYLILILGSVTVCAWTLVHFGTFPNELWFLLLETVLTCSVLGEVSLRVYLQGCRTFIVNWSNLFDLGVIVCSLAAVILALMSAGIVGEIEGLSGEALLVFYCSVQYLRLALFLKNRFQTHVPALEISVDEISLTPAHKQSIPSFESED